MISDPSSPRGVWAHRLVRGAEWTADFCRRHCLAVSLLALLLTMFGGWQAATHLSMDSDTLKLISPDLSWRQKQFAYERAFPQFSRLLVVVIDAPTAGQSDQAARALSTAMQARPDLFRNVRDPRAHPFFKKNGLLFLSPEDLRAMSEQLAGAQPMIGKLAADPSLRGLLSALELVAQGVENGAVKPQQVDQYLGQIADIADYYATSRDQKARDVPKYVMRLQWDALLTGRPADALSLRRIILAQPVLDFTQLSAGQKAGDFVRMTAQEMGLTPDNGISVRLTGQVPLADEELSSVADGIVLSAILSVSMVALLLFWGLRRWRLIVPLLLTLMVGLIWTGWFAALAVGTLNPISVAFATLFIGIAVDFGIQVGTRYRVERHRSEDFPLSLRRAAGGIAGPLLLAAIATSVGFFAFLPTSYVGVSQLGLIAGVGMGIAVVLNLTLLPALIALFRPGPERAAVGYDRLKPVDHLLTRRAGFVLAGWALVLTGAAFLMFRLAFDFNALHLKDPKAESVATIYDLMRDPMMSPFTIQVLAPDREQADAAAAKLRALPEIYRAVTLSSFVPKDQDAKLAIIADMALWLEPSLYPPEQLPPPDDAAVKAAMVQAAQRLDSIGTQSQAARRLARALQSLAAADPDRRKLLAEALTDGIGPQLDQLRLVLQAEPVTLDDLPDDLRRDWQAENGKVRVEAFAAGDTRDNAVLIRFAQAVRATIPEATGSAITVQQSGDTVSRAFLQAGAGALAAIAVLLGLILRRIKDALLVIVPIILALILTGATLVLIGVKLNFANIIALPLMLGIGVAFSIYYVMQWRGGERSLLSAPLTRAIIFSALTTLSAFGSLALSSHPGTASMGILLSLSLAWVLVTTLFFLPSLLAFVTPRQTA